MVAACNRCISSWFSSSEGNKSIWHCNSHLRRSGKMRISPPAVLPQRKCNHYVFSFPFLAFLSSSLAHPFTSLLMCALVGWPKPGSAAVLLALSLPAKLWPPSSSSPAWSSKGAEAENKAVNGCCTFKPQPAWETWGWEHRRGEVSGIPLRVPLALFPWPAPCQPPAIPTRLRRDGMCLGRQGKSGECDAKAGSAGSEDARDEQNSLLPFWQLRSSELGHLG